MNPLSTELRNKLERTIVEARGVAEAGAKAALEAIAVHHHEPYGHMSPEKRRLRNHLRARARQLGDKQNQKGDLEINHLVWECAYEHWHRMLFARFLAENELLIEPDMGVAISLEECEELAKEEGKDLWTLASEFAQRMLPQIFRPDDPVLSVGFASEHRLKLENLLNDMEPAIFTASDSFGWVYQFWQSKRKKEVNQSGNKIGADELPAVTQLFTEPYMVSFLLDNSLGAWWAARRLNEADLTNTENEDELRKKATLPGMPLEFLRFVNLDNGIWTPAAGTFDGWPETLSELKVLDPCCGSGHFLVAAFLMLVPMRMEFEGLSAREAVDAVLRENLYGLEIDARCVELAVFAIALTAWRYPHAGGYRSLPDLNVACSGLAVNVEKEKWLSFAGENTNLRLALEQLYSQFADSTVLGSLIYPEASIGTGSLFELKWGEVRMSLIKLLSGEMNDEKSEMGVVAQGIAHAGALLSNRYSLICTNPPYLGTGKQDVKLKNFLERYFPDSASDIATSFMKRILGLLEQDGSFAAVSPQNWTFATNYCDFRTGLLVDTEFNTYVKVGEKGFESSAAAGAFTVLSVITRRRKESHSFWGIDVSDLNIPEAKAVRIKEGELILTDQKRQLKNPDKRILLSASSDIAFLSTYAQSLQGIKTGDDFYFKRNFWELSKTDSKWRFFRSTVDQTTPYGGMEYIIKWDKDGHDLARLQGLAGWGKKGIAVSLMRKLRSSIYLGEQFDSNIGVIIPGDQKYLPAIWSFCESDDFDVKVREIDPRVNAMTGSLVKVPFDLSHWTKVAEEKYPNGLPHPSSEDLTQWIFHGYPVQCIEPLHVAVARLIGYRWPTELDDRIDLANEQLSLVNKCDDLLALVDEDGIACIPSVRGDETADSRLRKLLSVAFGSNWSPSTERQLIKVTGSSASNLDEWLRDHFFEQHCKLFHHRPFVWHIWDGRRRDGFHALINYHKLAEGNEKGRQLLENLTYSYLGEWITRQKEGVKRGEGGAEDRLAAALELQKRLIAIIEGEPPFDIFVRWKPIEDQPIGWEPDINDGVRLNIRSFLAQDIPGGRKGAGILRWKPNIKWGKDRGKEPFRSKEQYPWFWEDGEFTGDRVNDIHLTNEEKRNSRDKGKKK